MIRAGRFEQGYYLDIGPARFCFLPRDWQPPYFTRRWGTIWFGVGPLDIEIR